MDIDGRVYIFGAAALLFLMGSFSFYDDMQDENAAPTKVVTQAAAVAECDQNAIELGDMRLGCQTNTGKDVRVRRLEPSTSSITGGGAKFVSASR